MPAAPTDTANRSIARGVLADAKDGLVVLAVPDTDYRVQLTVSAPLKAQVGDRIAGFVRAQARRVDVIKSGGSYLEPVAGRPRRVQGRILAVDAGADTITVGAGAPIVCRLGPRQKASQFQVAQMVSLDVEPGASFTPA